MFFELYPTRALYYSEALRPQTEGVPRSSTECGRPRAKSNHNASGRWPRVDITPNATWASHEHTPRNTAFDTRESPWPEDSAYGQRWDTNGSRGMCGGKETYHRPRYSSPSPPERERAGYRFYDDEEPWAHLYAEAAFLAEKRTAVANEWAKLRADQSNQVESHIALESVHRGVRASSSTFDRLFASFEPRVSPAVRCRSRSGNAGAGRNIATPIKDLEVPIFGRGGTQTAPPSGEGAVHSNLREDCVLPADANAPHLIEAAGGTATDQCEDVITAGEWLTGTDVREVSAQDPVPQHSEAIARKTDDCEQELQNSASTSEHEPKVPEAEGISVPDEAEADSPPEEGRGECSPEPRAGLTSADKQTPTNLLHQSSEQARYSTPQRPSVSTERKKRISSVRRNKTPRKASPSPSSPARRRRPSPSDEHTHSAHSADAGLESPT